MVSKELKVGLIEGRLINLQLAVSEAFRKGAPPTATVELEKDYFTVGMKTTQEPVLVVKWSE